MRRAFASALLASACLGGAAAGQDWTGPAGVGVEVRDEGGQPIQGAAVVLVPGGAATSTGAESEAPPFVFTDAGGRIEVRNLAEGEWQVEVRAAGYMIFNGYLKLAATAAPEVGFSSRQRTGTFWQPLEVRFFVPGSPGDAVMVAATKEERRGEKKRVTERAELEQQQKKAKEREETRERRRTKASGGAEVAVLKEPPEKAPEEPPPPAEPPPPPAVAEAAPPAPPPPRVAEVPPPAPPPARPVAPPPATPPQPVAPPQPAPPPPTRSVPPPPVASQPPPPPARPSTPASPPPPVTAPAPPPTQPAVPPPVEPPPAVPPAVEPPPPTEPPPPPAAPPPEPRVADATRPSPDVAAPAPAPRDAAPAVPSIQARPVLFTGGACPECKPGEWALVVERLAAPGASAPAAATTCGEGREAAVRRLAQEALAPAGATIAPFAGAVADAYGNGLPAATWQAVPADLAEALRPRDGSCQDLAGVLPQGARFIGFRYEAEDASGKGDCFGEDPCAIGKARWTNNPKIERTATVTVIHSSFLNESTSVERRARMTIYFQPPRGWRPPA